VEDFLPMQNRWIFAENLTTKGVKRLGEHAIIIRLLE
jgi:hypothetical protein